jgi:hypothetical protein
VSPLIPSLSLSGIGRKGKFPAISTPSLSFTVFCGSQLSHALSPVDLFSLSSSPSLSLSLPHHPPPHTRTLFLSPFYSGRKAAFDCPNVRSPTARNSWLNWPTRP